jgi:hypothetical protein
MIEQFPPFTHDEEDPFERLGLSRAKLSRCFRSVSTPGSSFDCPIDLDSDSDVKSESSDDSDDSEVRESIEAVSPRMRTHAQDASDDDSVDHYVPFSFDEGSNENGSGGEESEESSSEESDWHGFDD